MCPWQSSKHLTLCFVVVKFGKGNKITASPCSLKGGAACGGGWVGLRWLVCVLLFALLYNVFFSNCSVSSPLTPIGLLLRSFLNFWRGLSVRLLIFLRHAWLEGRIAEQLGAWLPNPLTHKLFQRHSCLTTILSTTHRENSWNGLQTLFMAAFVGTSAVLDNPW